MYVHTRVAGGGAQALPASVHTHQHTPPQPPSHSRHCSVTGGGWAALSPPVMGAPGAQASLSLSARYVERGPPRGLWLRWPVLLAGGQKCALAQPPHPGGESHLLVLASATGKEREGWGRFPYYCVQLDETCSFISAGRQRGVVRFSPGGVGPQVGETRFRVKDMAVRVSLGLLLFCFSKKPEEEVV